MQMAKWRHVRAMRDKIKKKRGMRFPELDCGHGIFGRERENERLLEKCAFHPPPPPSLPSEQLFNPDEISLSAGLARTRDIQRNSGQRRRGEDERNAEIDGEACEGERKVERRQCGAISAGKNGSTTISHLHSRGRTSIRGNLKASPALIALSRRRTVRRTCARFVILRASQ